MKKLSLLVFSFLLISASAFTAEKNVAAKVVYPKIGDQVPDFEVSNRKGERIRLSDLRGNIVLVNFWATWCPPCIQELPYLELLSQRFKTKPFTLLAVSVDEAWADIDGFFAKVGRKPSFLVALDENKNLSRSFGSEKFPETYIIDQNGRLREKVVGAINFNDAALVNRWEGLFRENNQNH